MKRFCFLISAICTGLVAHAQLTVNPSGYVGIRGNANSNYGLVTYNDAGKTALYGKITHSGSLGSYGVLGESTPTSSTNTTGRCYGVIGKAGASSLSFGVTGMLLGTSTVGAGVYGTAYENYGSSMNARYAGYFAGNVLVTGSINGTLLTSSISPSLSDSNIILESPTLAHVSSRLNGVGTSSYYINATHEVMGSDGLITEDNTSYIGSIEKQLLMKQHFGLDADQLEEVFPDLVYENEDGTKSINYVEMVPILVQAINELTATTKTQAAQIAALEESNGRAVKAQTRTVAEEAEIRDEMGENVTILSLGENRPNPFSDATTIPVSIPETVERAFIYVYDLTGKKVQQVDITARGKQNITLDASTLSDGMYLYSLISDGKVVQTRRMIFE